MIRDIVAHAWEQDAREVIGAVVLTPVAVLVGWLFLVFFIVAGQP